MAERWITNAPGKSAAFGSVGLLLVWSLAGPLKAEAAEGPNRFVPSPPATTEALASRESARSTQQAATSFNARLACQLPPGETVAVRLREVGNVPPYTMSPVGAGSYRVTLPLGPGRYHYKYCRNYMDQGADEAFDGGNGSGWRELDVGAGSGEVWDTIDKWRWWPRDGVVPPIDTTNHRRRAPLPGARPGFQRGVMLPDFWWPNFSNDVSPTLAKIRARSGADWVQYSPIPEITRFYPTPLLVREGANGTPEAELVRILTSAKAAGLKVFLNPFPWPSAGLQDGSPQYHSDDWWRAYEQQWRPVMLYYAELAARLGVEMLGVSMWPSVWNLSDAEIPVVDALARSLLADVRAIYPGLVLVPYNPFGDQSWTNRLNLLGQADILGLVVADFWPFRLSDSKQPTVATMTAAFRAGVDGQFLPGYQRWAKPMVLTQLSASSYDGSTTGSPYWESQLYYNEDDPAVPVDLQEQADAYEAMLEVAARRDWIVGVYSFNYNYWDSLDKAPSIRAKPAEVVLGKWYGWLGYARCPGVTDPAASMTTASTAVVTATVNPHGAPTAAWFEYGRTMTYGSSTPSVSVGASSSDAPLAFRLDDLSCGTAYHVRGCAGNGGVCDVACTADVALSTPPCSGVPTIRLLSPRGGESLTPGSVATIRWTAEGIAAASSVSIDYLDGEIWLPIASVSPSTGETAWLVSATSLAVSRIRVSGRSEGGDLVADESGPLRIERPVAFHVLAPCRIADTRDGSLGGPALEAGETRRLRLTAGGCGVPITAQAVALNLTVTQPTAQGHIAAVPADALPSLVSSLNYRAGLTRANNAVVAVGTGGAIDVTCRQPTGGTVHVVVDVTGYFE